MPSRRATAFAVVAIVAGQHDDPDAFSRQRLQRIRRRSLDRIGDREQPGELAVDGDVDDGRAISAQRSASSSSGRASIPSAARYLALPSTMDLPSTLPVAPLPVGESNSSTLPSQIALLGGAHDGGGQRMFAGALDAGRKPQDVVFVESGGRHDRDDLGLPSVSVPVLSTTSVSIFSMRSSASAFLISTPACAPRPTPTMIDIGVARPARRGRR